MNHPLQCKCGTLKGHVSPPDMANRGVCYCKDCQAFANFLERPGDAVLDELGGLLRWYASCCNTPIGNTPRDFKTPYVGLIHSCLAKRAPSLQESFGPVRMVLQTKSAKGQVKSTPMSNFVTLLRIMKAVFGARISGAYKRNPFFIDGSGAPIRQPRELTKAERAHVTPRGS